MVDRLSPAQQAALRADGYSVIPARHLQFHTIYRRATDSGQPVFDHRRAVAYLPHPARLYAARGRDRRFASRPQRLNGLMLRESVAQYEVADGATRKAPRLNLAYFAVASLLLDPTPTFVDPA